LQEFGAYHPIGCLLRRSVGTLLCAALHTFNNQAVDGHMTVNSGARCSIKLKHSAGPTYGAHIVQCASNGTVTVDGRNRIVYRSRAGYVGSDSFTYARTGESRVGEAVARTVSISVTVTP
jgi:hypothetical protein